MATLQIIDAEEKATNTTGLKKLVLCRILACCRQSFMTALIIISGLTCGLTLTYLLVIRPWHLRWGATDNEINSFLPGDNLVVSPDFNATRGISINALPREIWKWIIQIGSKRAGWYSIDWIDNGGKESSSKILSSIKKLQ